MLQGLAPIVSGDMRLVVLGSFPGARSLALQQYYAHPQNQFWKILSALWQVDLLTASYAERCAVLLAHRLGLWDVYARCERQGSLDSAIRNPVVNNFAALARDCRGLQATAHNGGESFRNAGKTLLNIPAHRLPSTSPAHASWSFSRKLDAWQVVFAQHGLV